MPGIVCNTWRTAIDTWPFPMSRWLEISLKTSLRAGRRQSCTSTSYSLSSPLLPMGPAPFPPPTGRLLVHPPLTPEQTCCSPVVPAESPVTQVSVRQMSLLCQVHPGLHLPMTATCEAGWATSSSQRRTCLGHRVTRQPQACSTCTCLPHPTPIQLWLASAYESVSCQSWVGPSEPQGIPSPAGWAGLEPKEGKP